MRKLLVPLFVMLPRLALGWGQPTHAAIAEYALKKGGAKLDAACTSPATRDVFVYGSYSPDIFLMHGPRYIHVDRDFSKFMYAHAKDQRQLALAHGWGAHQEQDTMGHGRYIVEHGLPHVLKELSVDTRLYMQGPDFIKHCVRNLQSIWDDEQIAAASADYAAKYGNGAKTISAANARASGYVYSAYLGAVKGAMIALWYGRLKWKPELYPKTDWDPFVDMSADQTLRWCLSPQSFASSSQEIEQRQNFAQREGGEEQLFSEDLPPAPEMQDVSPEDALAELKTAMNVYRTEEQAEAAAAAPASHGLRGCDVCRRDSHVLLDSSRFVELGNALLTSGAMSLVEQRHEAFHVVRIKVQSKRRLLKEMVSFLGSDLFAVSEGAEATEEDDFFTQLKQLAEKGLDTAGEGPEDTEE